MRLSYGTVGFCFQGDIEDVQEAALARGFAGKACEVYLIGHHGSGHASSTGWLAGMDPEVAVVSFGLNGYGHPTAAALCRVQQAGAAVYATYRAGTGTIITDGATVSTTAKAAEVTEYCAPGTRWAG